MVDPIPVWIRIQAIPTLALWVTIPAPDPPKSGIVTTLVRWLTAAVPLWSPPLLPLSLRQIYFSKHVVS